MLLLAWNFAEEIIEPADRSTSPPAVASSAPCPNRRSCRRDQPHQLHLSGLRRRAGSRRSTPSVGIPTNSCLLLDDRGTRPRGIPAATCDLTFCHTCGFCSNTSFDPALSEYSQRYEETQGFSGRFVEFARDLAGRWVDTYDLAGRSVLEIGCGKGEFLTMMVEAGAGHGIGIDPGVHAERVDAPVADQLSWIADFYGPRLLAPGRRRRRVPPHARAHPRRGRVHAAGPPVDRRSHRHDRPVRAARRGRGSWTRSPSGTSTTSTARTSRWARWPGSSAPRGSRCCDLDVEYDDQYLLIEARPSETPAPGAPLPEEEDPASLVERVDGFATGYAALHTEWLKRLAEVEADGGKTVIWGAGSKGVSFLTNLGRDAGIEYAVDINPYKHGKFMAGTGHEIVGPEFLRDYRPGMVVAMNPIYLDEIGAELDRLGVDTKLVAV